MQMGKHHVQYRTGNKQHKCSQFQKNNKSLIINQLNTRSPDWLVPKRKLTTSAYHRRTASYFFFFLGVCFNCPTSYSTLAFLTVICSTFSSTSLILCSNHLKYQYQLLHDQAGVLFIYMFYKSCLSFSSFSSLSFLSNKGKGVI